jgi:hypothetical protein
MIFNVQKIIVGALPLVLMIIGLKWIAGLITLHAFIYRGCMFVLVSWVVGHVMTIWTNWCRDIKHRRGI